MIYQDKITEFEFMELSKIRGVCVSIYITTSQIAEGIPSNRLSYKHMVERAMEQAYLLGEKEKMHELEERLLNLLDDYDFWFHPAKSLVILADQKNLKTLRLAYEVSNLAKATDRFYLKPLLPALHPEEALVLAISQKSVKLYKFTPTEELIEVLVPHLPQSLNEETGRDLQHNSPDAAGVRADTGKKILQLHFVRGIEKAVRPILSQFNLPLIIAATEEIAGFYHSINSYKLMSMETIVGSVEHLSHEVLIRETKAVIKKLRHQTLEDWQSEYWQRSDASLASSDLATIARLATQGQVRKLLVDVDSVIYGRLDNQGAYRLLDEKNIHSYDLIDEIVDRVMLTGGKVIAVRHDEKVPGALLPISASFRWA